MSIKYALILLLIFQLLRKSNFPSTLFFIPRCSNSILLGIANSITFLSCTPSSAHSTGVATAGRRSWYYTIGMNTETWMQIQKPQEANINKKERYKESKGNAIRKRLPPTISDEHYFFPPISLHLKCELKTRDLLRNTKFYDACTTWMHISMDGWMWLEELALHSCFLFT